jgi:hypothetical protein
MHNGDKRLSELYVARFTLLKISHYYLLDRTDITHDINSILS